MKMCRYVEREASSPDSTSPRYGLIEGENVIEISGPPWGIWSRGSRSLRLTEVRLLAPVDPSNIGCIVRNYPAHSAALANKLPQKPLIFSHPHSAHTAPQSST